jgi:hypothetical protein
VSVAYAVVSGSCGKLITDNCHLVAGIMNYAFERLAKHCRDSKRGFKRREVFTLFDVVSNRSHVR